MNATHFEAPARFPVARPIPRRRLVGGLLGGSLSAALTARGSSPVMAQTSTPMSGAVPSILQE